MQGYVVFWDPPGPIRRKRLEDLAAENGLEKYVPRIPAKGNVVRRALSQAAKGLRKRNIHFEYVPKNGDDDMYLRVRFFLVDRNHEDVDMHKESILSFNTETYLSFVFPPGLVSDVVNSLVCKNIDNILGISSASDVTKVMKSATDALHLIPLRKRGSIYFCPAEKSLQLKPISDFTSGAGGDFVYISVEVPDDRVKDGMADFVEKTLEDIRGRAIKVSQQAALNHCLEDLDDLRTRRNVYEAVLGGLKATIDQEIEDVENIVQGRIAGEPPTAGETFSNDNDDDDDDDGDGNE